LIIVAVIRALQARYEEHRRWARWAAPVWLYVSVTGVLVYLMLYVWYPPVP
jgi:putative membrane protein